MTAALALGIVAGPPAAERAFSAERVMRLFDGASGIPSPATAVAQDSEGFLWIGSYTGLWRYDGHEARHWAADGITVEVIRITVGPRGDIVVVDSDHQVWQVHASGARRLAGADGAPLRDVTYAAHGPDGRLWIVQGGRALARDGGHDTPIGPASMDRESVRRIVPIRAGVFVITRQGLWRQRADGIFDRLLTIHADDVVADPGGRVFVAYSNYPDTGPEPYQRDGCGVLELVPAGAPRIVYHSQCRALGLTRRGDTLWLSAGLEVVMLAPGTPAERVRMRPPGATHTAFLLDREGLLWFVLGHSLAQMPEPDTALFGEGDGLPYHAARYLRRDEHGVWVSTWGRLGRLVLDHGAWRAADEGLRHLGHVCGDGTGAVILRTPGRAVVRRPGHPDRRLGGRVDFYECSESADGTVWMIGLDGLMRLDRGAAATVSVTPPAGMDHDADGVFVDTRRRLWMARGDDVCRTDVAAARDGRPAWSCDRVPGVVEVSGFTELAGGRVWMATLGAGILEWTRSGWQTVASSQQLPSRFVHAIRPARGGGNWVAGIGFVIRIDPPSTPSTSWVVRETIGPWHGLPSASADDVIEQDDGTLWVATQLGVARVPALVRTVRRAPPPMALASLEVGGHPIDGRASFQLPSPPNQVQVTFAALSFRDRELLRYRVRLHERDDWAESRTLPVFRFVDLAAGRYRAQVEASLDGVQWSPPAEIAFDVERPWYQRRSLIAGGLAATALLLLLAHRARLNVMLRLERQRSAIAMDLHDEMGSGLGSIGILAGLAGSDTLPESARRELHARIEATVTMLGGALDEIVWALNHDGHALEGVARRLAERGAQLYPIEGQFTVKFPECWPPRPLPLVVHRNVFLIALEALHNTARHADATEVVLEIAGADTEWSVIVSDNGRGIRPTEPQRRSGRYGIPGMQRRSAQIGGTVSWATRAGGGTSVTLRFDLRGPRGRLRSLRDRMRWPRRFGGRAAEAAAPDVRPEGV